MTQNSAVKVLLIGYGNPGRLDDGLGPALAENLENENLPNVTIDSDYQLNIENAAEIAEHDYVIFADAALQGREPFYFERLEPKEDLSFTTHSVSAPAVLDMAHHLFKCETKGYVLGIRGYEFNEYEERLSEQAKSNLKQATDFILGILKQERIAEAEDIYKALIKNDNTSAN